MRDFTYIDDIIDGVLKILPNSPKSDENGAYYKIYNIGDNQPQKLMDFIETLEKYLGKKAIKEFMPMQPGDVYQTYADISELIRDFEFRPTITMEEGIERFVRWFLEYY